MECTEVLSEYQIRAEIRPDTAQVPGIKGRLQPHTRRFGGERSYSGPLSFLVFGTRIPLAILVPADIRNSGGVTCKPAPQAT